MEGEGDAFRSIRGALSDPLRGPIAGAVAGSIPFLTPCLGVKSDPDDVLTGRVISERPHPYRSAFQRDRARIIHSRAFRRLAGKTQVFTNRYSDHFRSRLTHTMEVAQIARTIAHALGLNEDLTEALALVHDIGHPPFGHAGEQALDELLQPYGLSFDHNIHALRMVEYFEQQYLEFRGLNLTLGVREGIVKHSRDYNAEQNPELSEYFLDQQPPLEAQLIDYADEIAYLTADLDDGLESGILPLEDLRGNVDLLNARYSPVRSLYPDALPKLVFNEALKQMLNDLVNDVIEETRRRLQAGQITTLGEVRSAPDRVIGFSPRMDALRWQAKQYLYDSLYHSEELARDQREAALIIQQLFDAWVREPGMLPPGHEARMQEEGAARVVADYLAGMTDQFILAQYQRWKTQAGL